MLIHVEQRHINDAMLYRYSQLPWGCRCPIARAACEQLGLPLGSVYAGPINTYINWNGEANLGFSFRDIESRWFTTDGAGDFMTKVDNARNIPTDIEPCTVELSQRPLHCPVDVTPDGFTAVSERKTAGYDYP